MRIRPMSIFVILAACAAAFLLSGCLFEPREAQDPGSGADDTWIDPQVPEDVFQNLVTGLSEAGNSNYERSLSDNFTFVSEIAADLAQYGDVLSDWDRTDEMNLLNLLKGEYPAARSIRFGDEAGNFEDSNEGGSNPWYEGEYLYTLNDGSGEIYYGGIARFTFEESDQGKWVLFEWRDLDVLGSNSTGGNMRGRLVGSAPKR